MCKYIIKYYFFATKEDINVVYQKSCNLMLYLHIEVKYLAYVCNNY